MLPVQLLQNLSFRKKPVTIRLTWWRSLFRVWDLRPMNQGLVTLGAATNFAEFVDTVYIPVVLPLVVPVRRSGVADTNPVRWAGADKGIELTCPLSLMKFAELSGPPRVRRSCNTPLSHRNALRSERAQTIREMSGNVTISRS